MSLWSIYESSLPEDSPMEVYIYYKQFLSNIPTLIAKIHHRMSNRL